MSPGCDTIVFWPTIDKAVDNKYVIANYSFINDTPCRQNELAGKGSILHSDIPKEVTFLSDGVILNVGSAL